MHMLRRRGSEAELVDDEDFQRNERDDEQQSNAPAELPRSAEFQDKSLVARAAREIRSILSSTVTRGMQEVGDCLLREFYADSPAMYQSASHTKHVSLRLLEEQCETIELPVRRTFLANALRIAVLSREFPRGAKFLELPASHRVELLGLRTPDKIEQIAAKAVESNLSVKEVREIVRKDRERNKSPRGRRRTPAPLLALRTCVGELRDPDTGRLAFLKEEICQMDEDELAEAAALAETLLKRAEEFARLIG